MDADKRLVDAIRAKDARRVRAAIAAGAGAAGADGQKSPLHLAAEVGDLEVLQSLPRASVKKLINQLDPADRTPLMCAAQKGNIEAAAALIEMGAEVNARNSTGDTALRVAASDGTPEMARLLLEAGGDPLIPGRLLLTPLDRARERHTPEGRMIAAIILRAQEAARIEKKAQKSPQKAAGGRKSKQTRRAGRRGVK
jgi:ankyrin repeat protein